MSKRAIVILVALGLAMGATGVAAQSTSFEPPTLGDKVFQEPKNLPERFRQLPLLLETNTAQRELIEKQKKVIAAQEKEIERLKAACK